MGLYPPALPGERDLLALPAKVARSAESWGWVETRRLITEISRLQGLTSDIVAV